MSGLADDPLVTIAYYAIVCAMIAVVLCRGPVRPLIPVSAVMPERFV